MPAPDPLFPCRRWVAGWCTSLRVTASRLGLVFQSSTKICMILNHIQVPAFSLSNSKSDLFFQNSKNSPFFTQVLGEFLLQVAASTNKEMESQIPNYPNLPPQLICQLHNVTMHVSVEPYNTLVTWASNLSVNSVLKHLCYSLPSGWCRDRWGLCADDITTTQPGKSWCF
jgi:hypothetical protein